MVTRERGRVLTWIVLYSNSMSRPGLRHVNLSLPIHKEAVHFLCTCGTELVHPALRPLMGIGIMVTRLRLERGINSIPSMVARAGMAVCRLIGGC